MLRLELAFYLGCLNLHDRLAGKGEPACFPEPLAAGQPTLTTQGIYDVCLTLHLENRVVGNEVNADGKSLVMITGANQGGKSTLLRSLGLAHLMMQAGMFVGARSFRAGVCNGVFTHYKREEDATMESGKLDEELSRMSAIAGQITRHSILLCNESFASTNEREGSEIARQVVRAMLRKQIKVFFVTHMYDLAHSFHAQQLGNALFLRAERQPTGGGRSGCRGRAAADQLRRRLLPAHLRHCRTSADGHLSPAPRPAAKGSPDTAGGWRSPRPSRPRLRNARTGAPLSPRSTTARSDSKSLFAERTVVLLARLYLINQGEHVAQRRFAPG